MNRKKMIRRAFEVGVLILAIIGFIILNEQIDQDQKNTFYISIDEDKNYAYQIEEAYIDGEVFVIKGWIFSVKNVQENNIDIVDNLGLVLYDVSKIDDLSTESDKLMNGKSLSIEQRYYKDDICKFYKIESDNFRCGFIARIPATQLDLKEGLYRIIIKPDEKGKTGINTENFIYCGKINYTNPKNAKSLDVNNTDLDKIVNEGYCLVSDSEKDIYIFQLEKKLYWIAGPKYLFEEDGETSVQYQFESTQLDSLPSNIIDIVSKRGVITGSFEEYEVTQNMNCGNYRVSVRDIPYEYSIIRILTGYYVSGEWKWRYFFRPVFLYK